MDRKEFLKLSAIFGLSIPLQGILSSSRRSNFQGKVTIIGAGAAGLTAGYLLKQKGIDFQLLEASGRYGGRMKTHTGFADFPISLGAEWLHVKRDIFDEILNNPSIIAGLQTKPYDLEKDVVLYKGKNRTLKHFGIGVDQKFINSSWLNFFEDYILESVQDNIQFNEQVVFIDYSEQKISVKTKSKSYISDRVILTVPVKLLQQKAITFVPELPLKKQKAIDKIYVWDGFKAFIEFSERFYPTFTAFRLKPEWKGEKLYYDASYAQKTKRHILGLFTVGKGTLPYRELSDEELIRFILQELDSVFHGQASKTYIKHISQNWNQEAFAQGAYIYDDENWKRIRELGKSVHNRLYFAGDGYTDGSDWSSVHAAARAAIRAVDEILA